MGHERNELAGKNRIPRLRLLAIAAVPALLAGAACSTNPRAASRAFAQSGERYLQKKRFSEAAIQFRNSLQKDPANWHVRYELAQTEGQLGDWPASYRDLNAVLAAQPSFVPALLDLAEIDLMGGRTDLARREIDRARKASPANLRAEVLQMKLDFAAKKFEAASKQCSLLRSRQPKDASIDGMCGMADLGLRDVPAAEKDFRLALAARPGSASDTRDLANVLELEGHPDQAEALLTRSAAQYPNSLGMQFILADFYVRHGRIPEADTLLSGLFRHKPAYPRLAAAVGDFWMNHNELKRAVADYQMAESAHTDPRVERNLASAYLTLRQIPAAERYIQIILKNDPQSADGRALEGALDYLRGNYDQAYGELESALKDNPESLPAKYYLGMTFLATGQLDRAKNAFNDCIAMNDQFVQAYVKLGQIALEEGDWRLGAAYAKRVHDVNPASLDAYLLFAQAEMLHSDLAPAGLAIATAEKIPAAPPEVHEVAARYDILQRDFVAADKEFELASAAAPGSFAFTRSYIAQLAGAGQTQRAIADLQAWMAKGKPTPDASLLLAGLYLDAGQFDQAAATARQVLAQNPQAAGAHDILGEVFERRNQPSLAAGEFAASIRVGANQLEGYLLAANLSMHQGDYAQAQSEYQAALDHFPNSDPARLGLAQALGARGIDLDRALGIAQDLKARFPDNPRVADALGWIYHQKKIESLALPQLEQAAHALPHDAPIQFHLGMALLADGQKALGRATLSRALQLGLAPPDAATAKHALAAW